MHASGGVALLVVLCSAAFVGASPSPRRTVRVPFTKRVEPRNAGLEQRGANPISATLANDVNSYDITISVGSPPQSVSLQLDTGSSDLFVLSPGSCGTVQCSCPPGGCTFYDPSDSDTVALLDGTEIDYDFKFGSGEVTGAYITDGIAFSGVTIKSIIIGLTDASANTGRGIMGVGLPQGEQPFITPHPGVIGALYKQGSISANSYSLYLNSYNDHKGAIIFGGFDSSKYTGKLVSLPIVASPDKLPRLTVQWWSISVCSGSKCSYDSSKSKTSLSTNSAVLLDSGTTLAYIAPDLFQNLVKPFSLILSGGTWFSPCSLASSSTSLAFKFGSKGAVSISVSASQLIKQLNTVVVSGTKYCAFGIQPNPAGQQPSLNILGDAFLTSAYVYYNFDAKTISLAQAKWTSN